MTGVKMQHVMIVRMVAVRMVLIILGSPGLALKRVEMNVNLGDMVSNEFFCTFVFHLFHLIMYHLYMGIDAEPPMISMRPVCAASYSVSPIC